MQSDPIPEAEWGRTVEVLHCPVCRTPASPAVRYRFGPFHTRVCPRCTVEYLTPRLVKGAVLDVYARESYFRKPKGLWGYLDYAEEHAAITKTSRRRLRRLLTFATGGDLLEVGAGFGYFLEEAQAAGFRVTAVDVSDAAVARLRARFPRVHHGEFEALGLTSACDVLVLFDTIEHLYDLPGFVAAAHAALRPGGILAFTTPDTGSLSARVLGRRWWSYKIPEHVVYFNDASLATLLAGRFKIVHREVDLQYVSAQAAASRLRALAPALGRLVTAVVDGLSAGRIIIPVPNGMKLYVAARLDHTPPPPPA